MPLNSDFLKMVVCRSIAVVLIFCVSHARSQDDRVSLTFTVNPPYSMYLTDYKNSSGMLTIKNNTESAIDITIGGSFKGSETKIDVTLDHTTNTFSVPGNGTITSSIASLQKYLDFRNSSIIVKGPYSESELLSQPLPEDEYTICLTAYDMNGVPASNHENDNGCSNPILINFPDPPVLLNPLCEDTVTVLHPQAVSFQWNFPTVPFAVSPSNLKYVLKIVDVIPVTRDPNDAMNSATTPSFFERQVNGLLYFYGTTDPQFIPGHKYAVRVTVSDPSHKITFKNNGVSEVCEFTYGKGKEHTRKISLTDAENLFFRRESIFPSASAHELFAAFNPEIQSADSVAEDYAFKFMALPPISPLALKNNDAAYNRAVSKNDSDQISLKSILKLSFARADTFKERYASYTGSAQQKIKALVTSLDSLVKTGNEILSNGITFRKAEADYLKDELSALYQQLQELIKNQAVDPAQLQNAIDLSDDVADYFASVSLFAIRNPGSEKKGINHRGPYATDHFILRKNLSAPQGPEVVELQIYPYYYNDKNPNATDNAMIGKMVKVVPYLRRNDPDYKTNYADGNSLTSPATASVNAGRFYVRFFSADGTREVKVMNGDEGQIIDLRHETITQGSSGKPFLKIFIRINPKEN